MLPEALTNRMQKMLKEEYPDFLQSYNETRNQALRLNPLKGDSGRFLDVSSFHLTPVPFAENGYYYEEEDRPGKHPFLSSDGSDHRYVTSCSSSKLVGSITV